MDIVGGPNSAMNGLMHRSEHVLFDDLVSAGEQRLRNVEAERFCGLEIDNQLDFSRPLDGQIGRLIALRILAA